MSFIQKIIRKVFTWNITHNFLVNNFLISLKLDRKFTKIINPYINLRPDTGKTVQQIAGYSERREINEVLNKSKKDLKASITLNCKENDSVLDIGCGPGMYLSLFKENNLNLYGTDINIDMINEAKKNVQKAHFYHGDFLHVSIKEHFNFIYCIGVLIYIGRSDIKDFFKKIHAHLNAGGIFYLNYPHAISLGDVIYSDLTYIQYSPRVIEKLIEPYFEIIEHLHAFDGRKIEGYDKKPYKSLNPDTHRTYKNSYLLIAKKKL